MTDMGFGMNQMSLSLVIAAILMNKDSCSNALLCMTHAPVLNFRQLQKSNFGTRRELSDFHCHRCCEHCMLMWPMVVLDLRMGLQEQLKAIIWEMTVITKH